ncbi:MULTISPECIES: LysR family transcriptional regulator [Achromobacter]|jgi:DNA-binding transcriptional LysR family regulator|uniref:LysR family transcriptional regulator n=1 Tax=Achromobacter TaxID=222 RepID=UPI0006C2F242|nr:LysR family transcriptional regulator [Achromobacter kerstersii]CUJ72465.1 HTH-type transcriptional regulator gltC [Achromobacter kerstersii]
MLGDLKQLRAFLAIARLGNFTRAAYELHISQSALTIQIQQLEKHLRTELFDRNRRSVTLTPHGQELFPRIERLVAEIEDLVTHAREATDPDRGTVTVAALPSVAAGLLPRAIHRLNRDYPRITVRIRDTVAARLTYMIRNGEVDFGVGSPVKRDPELVWEKLMTDRFCAFVAPDYPWTKRNSVKFKDLAGPPLILPVRESSIRMHIEAAADKNKISLPAAYEAVYNSTITAMAAQGLGVAILSELVVRGDDTTRLRRIAIEDPPLYRYIGILRRAGRSLSRPAELLIGALREAASAD